MENERDCKKQCDKCRAQGGADTIELEKQTWLDEAITSIDNMDSETFEEFISDCAKD